MSRQTNSITNATIISTNEARRFLKTKGRDMGDTEVDNLVKALTDIAYGFLQKNGS